MFLKTVIKIIAHLVVQSLIIYALYCFSNDIESSKELNDASMSFFNIVLVVCYLIAAISSAVAVEVIAGDFKDNNDNYGV